MLSVLVPARSASRHTTRAESSSYALSGGMRHLLHWNRLPVGVFFTPGPALTKQAQQQVQAGFDEWVRASGGVIRYAVVASPEQADIAVVLDSDTTVPGQHGAAGSTALTNAHERLISASIEIATGHSTPNQVQEVAAHEFGHALGIDGHSDNPADLMAPVEMRLYDAYGSPIDRPAHAVTARDLNTLKACYGSLFAAPAQPARASEGADPDGETVAARPD